MTITLLLVGRDGNGKSSTGNSILGSKCFMPRSSSQTGAGEVLSGSAVIDGKEVTVVDGPGIGDTNLNDLDDVKLTLQNVAQALKLCSSGLNAVIIVFKYGVRFTQQEKTTVSLIREIFGENVFKDYGVVVMTHGDNFNADTEEDNMSFEVWCNAQTGDMKDLFNECKNRYVLFNNRAKDEWSLRIQRDLLLSTVAEIQSGTNPYTWTEYMKAENGRKRITVFAKKARLENETKLVLGDITNCLGRIDVHGNPESSINKIEKLQGKINSHKHLLKSAAEDTDIMKDLMDKVRVSESGLEMKLKLAKQVLRQREGEACQEAHEDSPIMDRREHEVGLQQYLLDVVIWCFNSLAFVGRRCWQIICRRIRQ